MDDVNEVGEQIVKKKKPRGGNSPVIGDNGLQTQPGDNAKYIAMGMELMRMPEIDLRNVDEVQQRISDYFNLCNKNDMKPAVSGLAMALGMDRRRLWEIKSGNYGTQVAISELPTSVKDSIKKAYAFMEILWENYMQNGKINPVSGIFLGKNNYGYKDQSEYVLTPNNPMGEQKDPDEIAKRYALEVGSDYEPEE